MTAHASYDKYGQFGVICLKEGGRDQENPKEHTIPKWFVLSDFGRSLSTDI